MKLNPEFVLRNIVGDKVIVPTGEASQVFGGLITLNEVGAFIFENIEEVQNREELVAKILEKYDVEEEIARKDVNGFLDMLKTYKMLLSEE